MAPKSKSKSKSKSKAKTPKPSPSSSSKSSSSSSIFKPGTRVEVSSDDDGFRGSWFSGTVIRRAGADKFTVEYDNLLADERGKKKLREQLGFHQLRPLPPEEAGVEFKFGDEVDAFHNDGWWEGSITQELENGMFAVYFRGSKEQIEFTADQLRKHREWMNEKWVPPFAQQEQEENMVSDPNAKSDKTVKGKEVVATPNVTSDDKDVKGKGVMLTPNVSSDDEGKEVVLTPNIKSDETAEEFNFSAGMLVEVSNDEEGFQGAWFSATVVEVIGDDRFLIEYKTLLDDNSNLLREEADKWHIRPPPPATSENIKFSYLEEVDAMYNDGWWVGVISKVLGDSKYVVYFRSSNEEIEFPNSQLRPHLDWIGGKWVLASEALNLL
ncbi:hypothetical protein HN51_027855 [Arachis hypogaea]|uniref:Protein AGENET DOMAIN (AGD)-CONTAINING P1 n=1 Tax=Arachis duranensis TaxID=130453 RepID=A0A6P4BGX2_ARADU|nr:protein AGENET DOMAIN (AGD)-CONTAINING P1 [Arachis duranensis]XP_025618850.1 DUF724 domain-containing protein 6 [Arachis hypogaea]QHO34291.1 uncharacterized protein DS421_9g265690 [Arachis hypogaea]